MRKWYEEKLSVICVLIDLNKAFDLVDRQLLFNYLINIAVERVAVLKHSREVYLINALYTFSEVTTWK